MTDQGTHLMDVRFVKPFFYRDEHWCWLANTGHWPDIGGAVPGGFSASATEIEQEGLRPDVICATSGGSLIGVLYAAGVYLMLRRNLVKLIFGLLLLGTTMVQAQEEAACVLPMEAPDAASITTALQATSRGPGLTLTWAIREPSLAKISACLQDFRKAFVERIVRA